MNILKRFYIYQHERFPLRILVLTTLTSVLASAAVTGNSTGILRLLVVFFASLFFIFHIRVIDESRDTAYDNKYYPDRPVQKGIMRLKELFILDIIGLSFNTILAVYFGLPAIVWLSALFVFSFLAWNDFFAPTIFRDRPLFYHMANSPQMVMLQLFIYALLTGTFSVSIKMWLLLIIVYINIFILELARKIKIENAGSVAGDVYSKSLGFKNALVFTIFLCLSSWLVLLLLLQKLSTVPGIVIFIATAITVICIIGFILHLKLKSKKSEKLMLLSAIIIYLSFNVLVYLSVI